MIHQVMVTNPYIKRYSLDKIVLFLLFVGGLLVAGVVINLHRRIRLSKPVSLDHSGLSVRVPSGNGWISTETWTYREDSFNLLSAFKPRAGKPLVSVRCQYLTVIPRGGLDEWLWARPDKLGGRVVQSGQISAAVTINWAHIQADGDNRNMFLGVAELPAGHGLIIQVFGEQALAQRAFELVAESATFEADQQLENGIEIVSSLRSRGIIGTGDSRGRQEFFLLADHKKQLRGFSMNMFRETEDDGQQKIRAADLYHIMGRYCFRESFEGDDRLERFRWTVEDKGLEIELAEGRVLNVHKTASGSVESYIVGPAAVPAILVDEIIRQMLEEYGQSVVLDVIFSDGRVVPTLISKIKPPNEMAQKNVAERVRLDILDGQGFYQEIYFDENRNIIRQLVQTQSFMMLQPGSRQAVLKQFANLREYILRAEQWVTQEDAEHNNSLTGEI